MNIMIKPKSKPTWSGDIGTAVNGPVVVKSSSNFQWSEVPDGTAKRFKPFSNPNFSMAIESGTSDPGARLIIESTIPGLDRELFDTSVRVLYERWGGVGWLCVVE